MPTTKDQTTMILHRTTSSGAAKTRCFFAVLLVLSKFLNAQELEVVLYNKTGQNLDSLVVADHFAGSLKKDSVLAIKGIKNLLMQGEQPMRRPRANILGKTALPMVSECSTKSKSVSSGKFTFDICLYEAEAGFRLYLKKHSK